MRPYPTWPGESAATGPRNEKGGVYAATGPHTMRSGTNAATGPRRATPARPGVRPNGVCEPKGSRKGCGGCAVTGPYTTRPGGSAAMGPRKKGGGGYAATGPHKTIRPENLSETGLRRATAARPRAQINEGCEANGPRKRGGGVYGNENAHDPAGGKRGNGAEQKYRGGGRVRQRGSTPSRREVTRHRGGAE